MGDPARGTPEFERLDHLVDQVEAYEAVHYPMSMPSAEYIAEYEAEKRGKSGGDAHINALRDGLLAVGATEDGLLTNLRGRRESEHLSRTRMNENFTESTAILNENGVTLKRVVAALVKNKGHAEKEKNQNA